MKEIHLMCIILEFLWLFKETKWCFVSVIMMKTGLNFNFQSKILYFSTSDYNCPKRNTPVCLLKGLIV